MSDYHTARACTLLCRQRQLEVGVSRVRNKEFQREFSSIALSWSRSDGAQNSVLGLADSRAGMNTQAPNRK